MSSRQPDDDEPLPRQNPSSHINILHNNEQFHPKKHKKKKARQLKKKKKKNHKPNNTQNHKVAKDMCLF